MNQGGRGREGGLAPDDPDPSSALSGPRGSDDEIALTLAVEVSSEGDDGPELLIVFLPDDDPRCRVRRNPDRTVGIPREDRDDPDAQGEPDAKFGTNARPTRSQRPPTGSAIRAPWRSPIPRRNCVPADPTIKERT